MRARGPESGGRDQNGKGNQLSAAKATQNESSKKSVYVDGEQGIIISNVEDESEKRKKGKLKTYARTINELLAGQVAKLKRTKKKKEPLTVVGSRRARVKAERFWKSRV